MTNPISIEVIRQLVRQRIAELTRLDVVELNESILIRDDFYCGRKFRSQGFVAVWFAEESEVKLFDPAGRLVQTLQLTELLGMHVDSRVATRQAA